MSKTQILTKLRTITKACKGTISLKENPSVCITFAGLLLCGLKISPKNQLLVEAYSPEPQTPQKIEALKAKDLDEADLENLLKTLQDITKAQEIRCQELHKRTQKMLKDHGFFVHYVYCPNNPEYVNIHTHGLAETFTHPDLQIIIPLDEKTALMILHTAVDHIKAGNKFEANKTYDNIIKGFKITFVETQETGRTVLRMILPDKDGNLFNSPIQKFKDQPTAKVD